MTPREGNADYVFRALRIRWLYAVGVGTARQRAMRDGPSVTHSRELGESSPRGCGYAGRHDPFYWAGFVLVSGR